MDQLTKKFGPLPVWAWALVLVGAYLLYKKIKSDQSASAATTAADTALGTGTEAYNGAGGNTDYGTNTTTSTTASATQWIADATSYFESIGVDPSQYEQALQDYFGGQPLSQTEYNLITGATRVLGAAPGQNVPTLAPTTSTTATAPATIQSPFLAIAEGAQQTAQAAAQFLGTQEISINGVGTPYNVYQLNSGQSLEALLAELYPGQDVQSVLNSGTISTNGTYVAVPVYGGYETAEPVADLPTQAQVQASQQTPVSTAIPASTAQAA